MNEVVSPLTKAYPFQNYHTSEVLLINELTFILYTFGIVGIGLKAAPEYCTAKVNGTNKRKGKS